MRHIAFALVALFALASQQVAAEFAIRGLRLAGLEPRFRIEFEDLSGRAKVLGILAKQYALSVPRPSFESELLTSVNTAARRAEARQTIQRLWTRPPLDTLLRGAASPQGIIEMTRQ